MISVENHFSEIAASVPSARMLSRIAFTFRRSSSCFSVFKNGIAFSIVSNVGPASCNGNGDLLINSSDDKRSITNASVRPNATSRSIPVS
ncbi:hypothetical protein PE36_15420 [Moritella sp. PE36]|nr:hypothetical protein PE36_15420 [Moritella sp. PE36]